MRVRANPHRHSNLPISEKPLEGLRIPWSDDELNAKSLPMFPADLSSSPSSPDAKSADPLGMVLGKRATYFQSSQVDWPAKDRVPAILVSPPEEDVTANVPLTVPQVNPKLLGAELHREKPRGNLFMFSCAPHADPLLFEDRRHQCLFFKTQVREATVHAMADTGATENFISAKLVNFLGLPTHPRKHPINIKIADGTVHRCDSFVRAHLKIGTWKMRITLMVFPRTCQLSLGCPSL